MFVPGCQGCCSPRIVSLLRPGWWCADVRVCSASAGIGDAAAPGRVAAFSAPLLISTYRPSCPVVVIGERCQRQAERCGLRRRVGCVGCARRLASDWLPSTVQIITGIARRPIASDAARTRSRASRTAADGSWAVGPTWTAQGSAHAEASWRPASDGVIVAVALGGAVFGRVGAEPATKRCSS